MRPLIGLKLTYVDNDVDNDVKKMEAQYSIPKS